MNFKKGDKVYVVIDGKIFEETASRDFWQIDAQLFKDRGKALEAIGFEQMPKEERLQNIKRLLRIID